MISFRKLRDYKITRVLNIVVCYYNIIDNNCIFISFQYIAFTVRTFVYKGISSSKNLSESKKLQSSNKKEIIEEILEYARKENTIILVITNSSPRIANIH